MADAISPGLGLEAARVDLTLSSDDLWVDYIALGGVAKMAEFQTYLSGGGALARHEHNTIAVALNERYLDGGGNHPVPYLE